MPTEPPVAKRLPFEADRHGRAVIDEYAWLADRDDPDTLAYLESENAYTDAWFGDAGRAALVDTIFDEIKRRTQETDLTVPVRKGDWWYLTRTIEGKNYPVHVRRPQPQEGDEQVLLDENAEAGDHPYFALGAFDISPSGRLLLWSSDTDGDEHYTMRIRDLATGEDRPDVLEGTYYGTAWLLDEEHILYVVPDDAVRPYQVWRHRLGTAQADDVLVVQEDDERFFVSIDLSRSEQFVLITMESVTTTEVQYVPAALVDAEPVVVEPRRAGHEYSVDHQGDHFVILTNDGAEDFRVVRAPVATPGSASWSELVAHEAGRRIQSVDAFDGFVVLHEWHDAVPRLRIVFDGGGERIPTFDEAVHAVDLAANPDYHATSLRYEFESLVTPRSVFEEDVRSGQRQLLKQTEVLDGFDAADYRSARTWATATDGTRVPIDLVWHRNTPHDGTAPAVVYGYAAYEHSVAPWFSIPRLSLLERGVVWALAHPRGGGELGRRWYLDGKLTKKRNSFTDLVACVEHLVSSEVAAPGRVAIRGGSAGGLLVGAALAMRPDLFGAVVAEVPFVDVVTTMLDPSMPLTVIERDEWGDPREPDAAAEMAAYAPYENVHAVDYPPLLVTAGLADPRVSYHEPAKWVARLRATVTGDGPILLRTELSAGHGGPSGRYDAWREEARTLTFLLVALGGDLR